MFHGITSRLTRVSWALLCPFILGPWASSPGRDSPLEPAQTWHGACPGPASLGGGGVPPPCECDLQVDVRVSFTFTPGWWPSRPRERQPRAEAHSVVARQWPRPCPPSSGICPEPGHTVGSLLAFPFCLFLKFFQSNIWRRGIQVHQGCESPREQQPRQGLTLHSPFLVLSDPFRSHWDRVSFSAPSHC